MFNRAKIIFLAAALWCGSIQLVVDASSSAGTSLAATKIQTAETNLIAVTTAMQTMQKTIDAAGDYVYTDAVSLILPMGDPTLQASRDYNNAVDPAKKNAYLVAQLNLLSSLVSNRERASKDDLNNLNDTISANVNDDYSFVITSPFNKATADLQQQLVTIAKANAKPVLKKQDFKSVIALMMTQLASAQQVDTTVFDKISDMVMRRLDDDDVLATVDAAGNTTYSYEFQTDTSVQGAPQNYFDASNAQDPGVSDDSKISIFNYDLSYENSWSALRGVIERVVGNNVYRAYQSPIDLPTTFGKVLQGSLAFRTEALGRLVAPITIDELVGSLDRIASIDTFGPNDAVRLMNRVRMLRTFLNKGVLKQTVETSRTIRGRMQFVLQSRLNATTAGSKLDNYKAEIQALLKILGSEAYNDQIPDAGTVVALQWKNPATGLFQYVNAVLNTSGDKPVWELHATAPDYFDDAALFYVISNADRIGFQCLKRVSTPAAGSPGLVLQSNLSGGTGVIKFLPLNNDPQTNLPSSITMLKGTPLAQFFMEGTQAAASFKSTSYVAGVAQQSGYLSIGPDGVMRTFNSGTKSPAGVFVNNALTAGPWETFSIVQVQPFCVDLARTRSNPDESVRIDFWKNAIKQLSADSSAAAKTNRLAVANELLLYIQSKPQRANSLTANLLQKFSDVIDFALSSFASFSLTENDLRLTLSKVVAEFEIPVEMQADGRTPVTMPASLPVDGQSVVIYVPSLSGSLSGRYLEVIQESLDATKPSYVLRASALDPVSPNAQFKASVFRDFISLESLAYPGNVFQVGVADDSYKTLAQEAKVVKLRSVAKPLAKDSHGLAAGFWDDINKAARLELIDVTDKTGEKNYLKCAANNGYLRVENDGYLRVYDISPAQLASTTATSIAEDPKNPGVVPSLATQFQVIPVKMLYTQLGALQSQTDELARVSGYKGLILQIETIDDIQVLISEVGDYINSKRVDQKTWTKFNGNTALTNSVLELLKSFRSSFQNALKTKSLDTSLSNVEDNFVIPPTFSNQTVLKDGDVVALGWQDDKGVTRYVSATDISFGTMQMSDSNGVALDLQPFVNSKMSQLQIGNVSPIDGASHFKVVVGQNSGVMTLQSLATSKNMQAIAFMNLIDIESRYASSDYANDKPAFDKYKADALGVCMEGTFFQQGIADAQVLEQFMAIQTDGKVSFKSAATGGFISVNPSNGRLVTIDPLTVSKAGQDQAGVLVPSAREKFTVIPVSAFVAKLGDILDETDINARFAKYLYHVTGAVTDTDRKVFVDSVAQEVAKITATADTWSDYISSPQKADARASLMALMNQLETDKGYQNAVKDEIEGVANQLDAGFTGNGIGGIPAKGSLVVLKTGGQNPKYIKAVPSQFNPSVYVLGAGADGSDDVFDPACIFVTDAKNGMLGLKSSLASNHYAQSIVVDVTAAQNWITAKRNAQTELGLTGTTFGSLGDFSDQLFKLVIVDQVAGVVQLQNVATNGFLSWVVGNALPSAQLPAVVTGNAETNAVSFVPSNRLRTIDPLTLLPFGAHTINVLSASTTQDAMGSTFVMTVFDEYYKMLMDARPQANYQSRFSSYGRALPLIKSEVELKVMLDELASMVNAAKQDKQSSAWKDFTSEDVSAKFVALLQLIDDNFASMLVDESNARNAFGQQLDSLRNYQDADIVLNYQARLNTLSTTLNTLTLDTVEAFMKDLTNFIADRTDGVVVVPANGATPASLNLDLVTTATTWLAENVYYNQVLNQAKKRDALSALIKKANQPVSFAEYVGYIDNRWISGKDHFTTNEKNYVMNLLSNMVTIPWLSYASAEDFDLGVAKDLLLRARANQMRGDQASVTKLNALLPQLVFPLIDGATYTTMITALIQSMRSFDTGTPAFMDAEKKLIAKASLWKTRVVLTGKGQLDVFNYATLLNGLLKDPLISSAIANNLKPILADLSANLSAQGINFTIASPSGDLGMPASSSGSTGSTTTSSLFGSAGGSSTPSGLSI